MYYMFAGSVYNTCSKYFELYPQSLRRYRGIDITVDVQTTFH